jgi:predicted secreted Zn-dependent protease
VIVLFIGGLIGIRKIISSAASAVPSPLVAFLPSASAVSTMPATAGATPTHGPSPTLAGTAPSPTPTARPTPRPTATPDPFVALPKLSVTIWHASIRYFAISGKNPNQLEASDQRNIPRSAEGDKVANPFAYTEPNFDALQPSYVFDSYAGSCTMIGLTGKATYQVTMPRWTSPSRVLPQMLTWWKGVLGHVRWHEEQHVRIFEKWIPTLAKRLVGHACSSGQSIINRWTSDVTAAQSDFDYKERTWSLKFPYTGLWIS